MPPIKKVQVDRLEQINDVPAYQAGTYLKIGSDNKPVFNDVNTDVNITASQVSDFQNAINANSDVQKGVTAYSWGNHALAGYLKVETDPVFSASPSALITYIEISNWNTALQPNGVSGILTIPNITASGTAGSLTITNGLITGFSNPT